MFYCRPSEHRIINITKPGQLLQIDCKKGMEKIADPAVTILSNLFQKGFSTFP